MRAKIPCRLMLGAVAVLAATDVRAGLVERTIHRAALPDAHAAALPPGESVPLDLLDRIVPSGHALRGIDRWNNESDVGAALFDSEVTAELLALVTETGVDAELIGNPFAMATDAAARLVESSDAADAGLAEGAAAQTVAAEESEALKSLPEDGAAAEAAVTTVVVPEPTVLLLLAAGIPAIIGLRPRRRK